MLNRRNFLQLAAGAAAVKASGRTAVAQAQAIKKPPRRFVIDSHLHFQSAPDYFERVVKFYRPRNAMACVLTPMSGFDATRKAAEEFKDVVIPYGRINVDEPAALEQINRFADGGFRGVKMHSPRLNWDDPHYFHLYERLQERKLVALFHTGIGSHTDRPQYTSMMRMRPGYLDTLTRAFPELYIQGAHLGNPWYDEAAEAARWGPRLHFDITGSTLLKKANNLASIKEYLWWQGPSQHSSPHAVYAFEKLVFGTDEAPEQVDNMLGRYEGMLEACAVPEESRKKIFGLTMAKILGIEPRA